MTLEDSTNTAGGTLPRRYIPGPGLDNPYLWPEGSGTAASAARWLLGDAFGSIIAVGTSGASNTTLGVNTHDEYGLSPATNVGRFQYKGMALIQESGLYYARARMYAPRLGRFMQPDPIGYGDGMNRYAFVHNAPVGARDVWGLYTDACSERERVARQGMVDTYGCSLEQVVVTGMRPTPAPHLNVTADQLIDRPPNSPTLTGGVQKLEEVVVTATQQTNWRQFENCVSDQLGLSDLAALAAIAAGQPIAGTKPFVTAGSSRGTSVAGMVADEMFGDMKFPIRVPSIVGGPGTGRALAIAGTRSVARFTARAVPIVGWGILAYDVANIGVCTFRSAN